MSLAFPSISTGAYRFLLAKAAPIAVSEILTHAQAFARIEMVCFDVITLGAYRSALKDIE